MTWASQSLDDQPNLPPDDASAGAVNGALSTIDMQRHIDALERELAERRRIEAELLEDREYLALAHEVGQVATFEWRPAEKISSWSHELEALHGFAPGQYDGTFETWLSRIHPDDVARAKAEVERCLVSGRQSLEFRVIWPDGSVRWLHSRGKAFYDDRGQPVRVLGVTVDVTDRKDAQTFTQGVLESSPNIVYIYSLAEQRYRYVTPQVENMLGYRPAYVVEMRDRFLPSIIHPEDLPKLEDKVARLSRAADGEVVESEYRVRHQNGQLRWVHCRNVVFSRTPDGRADQFLGTVTDVTDRKASEEALRESEQRYRGVVETQTELVCHYLPDATLTFVNEAYCRYFGRTREELIGTNFIELIPPEARDGARAHVRAVLSNRGAPTTVEHEVLLADGTVCWQQWIDHVICDADGNVVELQGIGRDVTERRKAEENLRRANIELSQLKDRLQAENVYLHEELAASDRLGEIVCRSATMRQTLSQVQRVAPTVTTALLLGETGTGKEVLARAIHRLSRRNDRPLVRVNCASLPANLIESELFGHERGAFTGAVGRRVGRFEIADGGTLFLDEIGELPLEVQPKLLRVLQEGEFERLGSSKTTKVNVRLIAATNRRLADCVRDGTFRADLYYRLNVFPINVPSLRDRAEDIEPLAVMFLAEAGRRLGRRFAPIPPDVLDALRRHTWPGNVRELQNVIERAAVTTSGRVLSLPPEFDAPPSRGATAAIATPLPEPLKLSDHERSHIIEALRRAGGRVEGAAGAAAMLGVNASTLRSRMKKLGVPRHSPVDR